MVFQAAGNTASLWADFKFKVLLKAVDNYVIQIFKQYGFVKGLLGTHILVLSLN